MVVVDPAVEFRDVATRFSLSGGSIRSCAVDAAFRAAARNGHGPRLHVDAGDFYISLAREYQKLGRPVIRSEFGQAYDLVVDCIFATTPSTGLGA